MNMSRLAEQYPLFGPPHLVCPFAGRLTSILFRSSYKIVLPFSGLPFFNTEERKNYATPLVSVIINFPAPIPGGDKAE